MKIKWASYPYVLWMIIFIIVPLGLVLLSSLTIGEGVGLGNLGFTLDNFRKFFENEYYVEVLWASVNLALKSTVISLLLGYPMAMIIAGKNRKRNIMVLLIVIPMWMNFCYGLMLG